MEYTENSRRGAAPVLVPVVVVVFFFVIGSLNMLDFTVSQVHLLLCYQLHRIMVLCVLVYVAERHALGSAHYS